MQMFIMLKFYPLLEETYCENHPPHFQQFSFDEESTSFRVLFKESKISEYFQTIMRKISIYWFIIFLKKEVLVIHVKIPVTYIKINYLKYLQNIKLVKPIFF